jgi:hypothetical protein
VLGWGVFRMKPWSFKGLYLAEADAHNRAQECGKGYKVAYGSMQAGTDNFIASSK